MNQRPDILVINSLLWLLKEQVDMDELQTVWFIEEIVSPRAETIICLAKTIALQEKN